MHQEGPMALFCFINSTMFSISLSCGIKTNSIIRDKGNQDYRIVS